MKKLLFATILSILSVAGFATDKNDDSKNISYNAKRQLELEFEKAENVSWTSSSDYQKATFTLNGKKTTAIFDLQGNYLGATQFVAYTSLPEEAKKDIEKQYKDYTFSEAILVVGRPVANAIDDIGTYWIDLIKEDKQVYLNYTPFTGTSLYKSFNLHQTAKN